MSSCEYGKLEVAILARANINDLCHGVSISASRQIALLSLPDTEMTSCEQYGELFCFFCFFLLEARAECMDTIVFHCVATGGATQNKFKFWVNNLFNTSQALK